LIVDAILDTGFTGALSLPRSTIQSLGLKSPSIGKAVLAGNRIGTFKVYNATVMLENRPKKVTVYEIDGMPLLGTKLLVDHSLAARLQVGGRVENQSLI